VTVLHRTGNKSFDPTVGVLTPAPSGTSAYVATFHGQSELLQAQVVSATYMEVSEQALGDDDGSLLIGGWYSGTADIAGDSFTAPDGGGNGFLALYDADGAPRWAEDTGGKQVRRVEMNDACEVTATANVPGSELYVWRRLR
jgi:hypothetical protein